MSLNLGLGSRRPPLPGAAARQRSAGASFLACAGGLVSTSAGGAVAKARRFGGPVEKLSKESYALALEEQIASRKLQKAESDLPSLPVMEPAAAPPNERVMGLRNGGPMAPTQKDQYASVLRAQIESHAARRAAEHEAEKAHGGAILFAPGGKEAPALGGRRRHGAPPMPTKESYASALEQQMQMRSLQKAEEASRLREDTVSGEQDQDALDDILLGRGRRHGGPAVRPAKSHYAADLEQQIMERKAQQAVDAESALCGVPRNDGFSKQAELIRGKRHSSNIDPVCRSGLNSALQEQMAERASYRAANAFHLRDPSEASALGVGQEVETSNSRGGRRKRDFPVSTKESYAHALQEQIEERKARQEGSQSAGAVQAAFVGGAALDMGPMRGRRHASAIVPASKEELRLDLQRQMAERVSNQAAMQPRSQAPAIFEDLHQHGEDNAELDALERLLGSNADHASFAY